MSDIRWEDPPPHGNTGKVKPQLAGIADELRQRPGQWALIDDGILAGTAGGKAARIRRGKGAWAPAGSFEARCVGVVGGPAKLYARYVGEPS